MAGMATPLRHKIVNNSASYLRPGEQVQAVLAGQTITGWWALLTYLFFFWLRYRAVLVTDQRILVLDTGRWSMTKPKGVVAELPRNVIIGPASGLWWKCLTLGEKLYVHKRFHKDVLAADTALMESGVPPQQIPLGGHAQSQGQQSQGQQFPGQDQWQAPGQHAAPQGQQWPAPQEQYAAPQDQWPAAQQQWPAPGPQGAPQDQWQQWPPAPGQQQWPAPQQAPEPPAPKKADPWRSGELDEPDFDNRTRIRPRPEE